MLDREFVRLCVRVVGEHAAGRHRAKPLAHVPLVQLRALGEFELVAGRSAAASNNPVSCPTPIRYVITAPENVPISPGQTRVFAPVDHGKTSSRRLPSTPIAIAAPPAPAQSILLDPS